MSGLCEKCMFKGDVDKCATAVCGQHESWHGVTQQATIEAQAAEISELEAKLIVVCLQYRNASLEIERLKADKFDADTNAQEWEAENKELKAVIQVLAEQMHEYCTPHTQLAGYNRRGAIEARIKRAEAKVKEQG